MGGIFVYFPVYVGGLNMENFWGRVQRGATEELNFGNWQHLSPYIEVNSFNIAVFSG